MSDLLQSHLVRLNRIRRLSRFGFLLLKVIRALLMAAVMLAVWSLVRPGEEGEQLVLSFLVFLVGMAFNARRVAMPISAGSVLSALEIRHPDAVIPPFRLREQPLSDEVRRLWEPFLDDDFRSMQAFETKRLTHLFTTMVIPAVLFAAVVGVTGLRSTLGNAMDEVSRVVAALKKGATVRVISGAPGEQYKEPISLGGDVVELELLMRNMVEIAVHGAPARSAPAVFLRRVTPGKAPGEGDSPVFQSFQLSPLQRDDEGRSGDYAVAFAVSEDMDIYLSSVSSTDPVARITVRRLPVPRVSMKMNTKLEEPWPDDKPLPLQIDVDAQNPLKQVRLLIRTGGRTSTEVVNNILASDKKGLSLSYNLFLEPYLQSDLADVEIVAEAVDRAVPIPLVGRSRPLNVKTASAYGRYRQTLDTLRKIKGLTDEALKNQQGRPDASARELMDEAIKRSAESPFFDGLDRIHLNRFRQVMNEIMAREGGDPEKMMEFSAGLNTFLFDHEILDDKERDRDFFVAARALSRLIEQDRPSRQLKVPDVTGRIRTFLDERHERWVLRAERLGKDVPTLWDKVSGKPFHQDMERIAGLDARGRKGSAGALGVLSGTVTSYREWIEALEEAEDTSRRQQENKRQEGLANARNVLRELQKRQGKISKRLDKSASRKESDLAEQWPPARMEQNTNIKAGAGLEGQLRSLSPRAAERMKAAVEAMRLTVESGNNKAFMQAESGADMAGRLLRQARNAARQDQRNQRRRGRRRRVTGDNYHGTRIIGGDVEIRREYEVHRRYREDILEEIRTSHMNSDDGDDAVLLENYLREVVR